MSRRVGKIVVLEAEPAQQCDFCGEIAELRPYGPEGQTICFDCAKKDPETTERRMGEVLFPNA